MPIHTSFNSATLVASSAADTMDNDASKTMRQRQPHVNNEAPGADGDASGADNDVSETTTMRLRWTARKFVFLH